MREWKKFNASLSDHPGPPIVFVCTILGFFAGLEGGASHACLGALVMSIFWVPVFWTAWTGRERYDDCGKPVEDKTCPLEKQND